MFEERQMDLLFGGDAFREGQVGPPTALISVGPSAARIWLVRVLAVLLLSALVVGTGFVIKVGLIRRAHDHSRAVAADLRQLLRIGSYAHAAVLLDALAAEARATGDLDSHAALLALGSALVWRFFDRDPLREAMARHFLTVAEGRSPHERGLADAALNLDDRPGDAVRPLRAALEAHREDLNAALLLGIAASKNGEKALAARAFRRAEELEPPHLASLYAQLEHWARTGDRTQADALLARMTDISPTSPWTALGRALLDEAAPGELAMLADADDAPEAVRARARELLEQ